jgi:5-methylcytosine-specific restriction protein A
LSWGFEIGRTYNRRKDIHARFGGQQQGGIITPADHALVIIITGEEGLAHGYADRTREDGVFEYFGEGQVGDMELLRGNRAIAEHSVNGKSLLLFRKMDAGVRFLGEMIYETHHIEKAPDRTGALRDAIVFELRFLSAVNENVEAEPPNLSAPLEQLRALALSAAKAPGSKQQGGSFRNTYQRSREVRNYVLARAKGECEGCAKPAPFARPDGSPYLEPHHLTRISDGGPDHPSHVIALCPNCHRRVHAGADGKTYNVALTEKMKTIEVPL